MIAVHFQFAHALQRGLIGDQCIANTYAQVTQNGRISQVTLPAGDRQFARQVLQNRIRQAQVTLRVFEIDRVHFVWHGRRTDFARDSFLLEVTQRNVTPDVAIEIDQNGIKAGDAIKQLSDVIVRLDLCGVWIPLDPKRSDELFAKLMPVNFRVSGDVGVIVTHSTVDFSEDFNLVELAVLTLHAIRHVCHFFAHR